MDDNNEYKDRLEIDDLSVLKIKGDYARNLMHPGYQSHEAIGLRVCSELEKRLQC